MISNVRFKILTFPLLTTVETRYNEIAFNEFCFIANYIPSPGQAPILKYGTAFAYNENAYSEFPCIAKRSVNPKYYFLWIFGCL